MQEEVKRLEGYRSEEKGLQKSPPRTIVSLTEEFTFNAFADQKKRVANVTTQDNSLCMTITGYRLTAIYMPVSMCIPNTLNLNTVSAGC